MTTKTLLNKTSKKKRDQMMSVSNILAIPASLPYSSVPNRQAGPATLLGNSTPYLMIWMPTARERGTMDVPAQRNSEVCYMKGLREKIRIQTNSGLTWKWRRICFTMKGSLLYSTRNAGDLWLNDWGGNPGYPVRPFNFFDTTLLTVLDTTIFKGVANRDYRHFIEAELDNESITVKYDKVFTIQSGNAQGVWRDYKMWHPMEKNINYFDDEDGQNITPRVYSTPGKSGMGDFYVIDIIQPSLLGEATDRLQIDSTSTLYWHER